MVEDRDAEKVEGENKVMNGRKVSYWSNQSASERVRLRAWGSLPGNEPPRPGRHATGRSTPSYDLHRALNLAVGLRA